MQQTQVANSMDAVSIGKIKRGLIISLSGAVLAGFSVFAIQMTTVLQNHGGSFDLYSIALTSWGALATSVINIAKEWLAGE